MILPYFSVRLSRPPMEDDEEESVWRGATKRASQLHRGGQIFSRDERLTIRVGPLPKPWEKKTDPVRRNHGVIGEEEQGSLAFVRVSTTSPAGHSYFVRLPSFSSFRLPAAPTLRITRRDRRLGLILAQQPSANWYLKKGDEGWSREAFLITYVLLSSPFLCIQECWRNGRR